VRVRRTFTNDFKKEVVEAVTSGQVRQLEMSRKYGISPVVISRWKREYSEGRFFENSNPDTTRLEIRLREMERLIASKSNKIPESWVTKIPELWSKKYHIFFPPSFLMFLVL